MNYTKVEDFNQKERNRAIEITDIAISKIKKVHFSGFTPEQDEEIYDHHIRVLSEAKELNMIHRTNKMEAGILIDIHTWEYYVIHGKTECEVQIKDNPDAYKAFICANKNQMMFIHNHPSTGTFSGNDLKFFCLNDSLYMMTVVGNDGSLYDLTKTTDFNLSVLAEYSRLSEEYFKQGYILNNGTLAIKNILERATEFGLEYRRGGR